MPCCYDFRSFLSHGVASGLLVSRTSRGKRPSMWPTSSNIFRVAHVYFFVLVVWCCTVQLGNFDVTMAFTCASSSSMCEASAVKVQLPPLKSSLWDEHRKKRCFVDVDIVKASKSEDANHLRTACSNQSAINNLHRLAGSSSCVTCHLTVSK